MNACKTTSRRQLRFNCLEDIRADVENLAKSREIQALGEWSPGQVLKHLALAMDMSIDGMPPTYPAFVRSLLRLLLKRRLLTKPMTPGFRLPQRASSLIPGPVSLEEGLTSFRTAFERLGRESKRSGHLAIGELTREEWDQLHCRHSELHLSFLVPNDV